MASWYQNIKTWLSGFCQLRHPSVVRVLGEMRREMEELEIIRRYNPGSKIERGVIFKRWKPDQLSVAKGASVCRGTILSCGEPVNGHGRIAIGSGTWIGQYNNLRTCPDSDITIGSNCLISQFCTLVSSNHATRLGQPIKDQPMDQQRLGITVGDDVWLGAGVTVLPGITIGSGAVIGANSVVTCDVPACQIWAGSPAELKSTRAT